MNEKEYEGTKLISEEDAKRLRNKENIIDLNNTWCEATEENFNALIDNNIECIVNSASWETIEKSDSYNSDDIFYIVSNYFDWYSRHLPKGSNEKQIHLVNGQFRYVEECAEDKGSKFKSSKTKVKESISTEKILKILEDCGVIETKNKTILSLDLRLRKEKPPVVNVKYIPVEPIEEGV